MKDDDPQVLADYNFEAAWPHTDTDPPELILDHHWWKKPGGLWSRLPPMTAAELLAASMLIGPIHLYPSVFFPIVLGPRDTLSVVREPGPDGHLGVTVLERLPHEIPERPWQVRGGKLVQVPAAELREPLRLESPFLPLELEDPES